MNTRHQIYNHLSVIGQLCKCLWTHRDFAGRGRKGRNLAAGDYRKLRDFLQHNPYLCFYDKDNTIVCNGKSVSDLVLELSKSARINTLEDQLDYILT